MTDEEIQHIFPGWIIRRRGNFEESNIYIEKEGADIRIRQWNHFGKPPWTTALLWRGEEISCLGTMDQKDGFRRILDEAWTLVANVEQLPRLYAGKGKSICL